MSKLVRLAAGALITIGIALTGVNAADAPQKFHAVLSNGEEVPPAAGTGMGKGTADFTLNPATREITWTLNFEGLTGDAVAAHIHGPADKGTNAGVILNLGVMGQPIKSPLMGKATISEADVATINGGKAYVNVHTAAHKSGEIRGQLAK